MTLEDKRLLNLIRDYPDFTLAQLAGKVNLSEKTIRGRLKRLETEISRNGGKIISKSGKGYQFRVIHSDRFAAWLEEWKDVKDEFPATGQERVNYILQRLLYAEGFVKLDALCEELFISRTSMAADMKQVKHILECHRLTVLQRPGYGICIKGEEFDIRNCMVNELLQKAEQSELQDWEEKGRRIFVEIVSLTFKSCNLNVSKQSFFALLNYSLVTAERQKAGHYVCFSEEFQKEIKNDIRDFVIFAAQRIEREIALWTGGDYREEEAVGFMIQINGKGVYDFAPPDTGTESIPERMEDLAGMMLDAVYEIHGLNLRDDSEMNLSLSQHLVSFDIRMRYGLTSNNPILDQIKRDYAVAYHIAVSACIALEQEYQKPVPEAEIGYFAILIALAMQKGETPAKKNILVVCVTGQASSRLFIHRVQTAFSSYVNRIYTCSAFQISNFDFAGMKVDYVFSTVPLHVKVPVPVFEVSPLLDVQEIHACRRMLQGESDDFILRYFKKELFCGKLPAATKETALLAMCQVVEKSLVLPDDFYDSVLEREKMGQTDFGNLVAIPHPCRIMGTEKFVSAAVLDKPIFWGHNHVQVVFLISLEQDDSNIERFYQIVSEFMSSPESVKALIQMPTFQTLLDILNHKGLK